MDFAQSRPLFGLPNRPTPGMLRRWLTAREQMLARSRRYIAMAAAIWLVIQMFDVLYTVAGSYELSLTLCIAWIALPLFLVAPQTFLKTGMSVLTAGRGPASVLIVMFLAACFLSALTSENTAKSAGYLLATIVTLVLEYELCTYLRGYFNMALRCYSVLGTLAYLPFYWRGALTGVNWGRLSVSEAEHPNHFALVCFSILAAAFAWRSWTIRFAISGIMIAMIMAAQSRSSLISAVVTITVFMALELKNRKAVMTALLAGGLTCMVSLSSFDRVITSVSALFDLQDQYRGVASGLSGRVDLWQAGIDIFLEHPLLGVGFRLQDEALPARFQAAGAVHNGFLGTLVEVGLLGSIPLFCFIAIGLRKLWQDAKQTDACSHLGISFVCGYLVSALVEPRLLNLAHPASVIAWCFLIGAQGQAEPVARAMGFIPPGFRATPMVAGRLVKPAARRKDWARIINTNREKSREFYRRS